MCVILFKPKGIPALSADWITNACDANSDGWGVSVRHGDGDETVLAAMAGFDTQEAINAITKFGEDTEVLFHARWATHGDVSEDNLHPFPMYDAANRVYAYMAHNGVVSIPTPDKMRSDTWHLVRMLEAQHGTALLDYVKRPRWRRKFVQKWGRGSKFAIMTHDGTTILNPEAGLWREGVWASNTSAFTPAVRSYPGWDEWVSQNRTTSTRKALLAGMPYGEADEDEYDWDEADTGRVGSSSLLDLRQFVKPALRSASDVLVSEPEDTEGDESHQSYALMYELRHCETVGDIVSSLGDYTKVEVARVLYSLVVSAAETQRALEDAQAELFAIVGSMEPKEGEDA